MTHEEEERVKYLLMDGWTTPQISRETLISEHIIRKFIKGTPFYDMAYNNWRRDLEARGEEQRENLFKNQKPLTIEQRDQIENLLLDGNTTAQVANETGISVNRICYMIRNTVYWDISRKNLKRWQEKFGRHYMMNQLDVTSRNHFLKKPKYIWTRYYVLICGCGLMLVDRMHERFSTERYWMEFSIKEYRSDQSAEARSEARALNREWHDFVRKHYGEKRK